MTDSTLYCIANPKAAGGRIKTRIHEVMQYFSSKNIQYEILWTERARHGTEIAQQLAESGKTNIVSIGGDGTAFEVINGIMRAQCAERISYGILPLGTGNSFLRDFGIVSWQDAAERIVTGHTQAVDVGQVSVLDDGKEQTVYFHNVVGLGLMAHACSLRHSRYSWLGTYAYHGAFFDLLLRMKHYEMRFHDGADEPCYIQSPLMAVCNSQYTGHDMHLSPRSNVQDGQFEMLYSQEITSWELLKMFTSLPAGTHLENPRVIHKTIQNADIETSGIDYFMVDGEIVKGSHIRIKVLPGAMKIYL